MGTLGRVIFMGVLGSCGAGCAASDSTTNDGADSVGEQASERRRAKR